MIRMDRPPSAGLAQPVRTYRRAMLRFTEPILTQALRDFPQFTEGGVVPPGRAPDIRAKSVCNYSRSRYAVPT
jgi:hypothetical protein